MAADKADVPTLSWAATRQLQRNVLLIIALVVFLAAYVWLIQGDPAACGELRRLSPEDYRGNATTLKLAADCNPAAV